MNSRPVSFKLMTKFLEENKIKSEISIEEERRNERIEEQRLTEEWSKDWKRGRVKIERGGEQRLKEGESNGVAEASVKSCDPAQSLGRLKAEESDISSPDFLQLRNPHPIITHHHLAVVQHTAAQQWIIVATRLGGIAGDFTVATTQGHRGTTAIKVEQFSPRKRKPGKFQQIALDVASRCTNT